MRRQSHLTRQYWEHVSDPARDFIRQALTIDQKKRMSAKQALEHPWLQADLKTHPSGEGKDLLPNMRANFDARRTLRKAIWSVRWANAVQKDSHANAEEKVRQRKLLMADRSQKIRNEAEDYKRDANEVRRALAVVMSLLDRWHERRAETFCRRSADASARRTSRTGRTCSRDPSFFASRMQCTRLVLSPVRPSGHFACPFAGPFEAPLPSSTSLGGSGLGCGFGGVGAANQKSGYLIGQCEQPQELRTFSSPDYSTGTPSRA